MSIEELKAKYPRFNVISEPSPTCPNCKGAGEYFSKAKTWQPCLCICIGGDREIRDLAAWGLHKKVPEDLRK
jgi:hypothetical protein